MPNQQKVAVVTGANKGIGFAIVKGLCKKFNGVVYLTARDPVKGKNAVAELKKMGFNPSFHQLDISNGPSVRKFRDYIATKYGGVDIFINNAGFQIFKPYTEPLLSVSEKTLQNNYKILRDSTLDMVGIFKFNARIINASSSFGHLTNIPGENIRKQFADPCLTLTKLDKLVDDFIMSVKRGTNVADGWGDDPYKIAKACVTAFTIVFQKGVEFTNIKANCYNPGYVNTDMTKNQGILTPDEGAIVPLYVALEAPNCLRGKFVWKDKRVIDWAGAFPDE